MSRAVLTYHSIDDSRSPISIAPDIFARHVAWLASGRVSVEPLHALLSGAAMTPDGRHRVAVTFDDAFVNFGTVAWPQLHAHGLPVTAYVVTGHVGGTNRWGDRDTPGIPRLPLASWDALAVCAAQGVEIGAHSHRHPSLPTLPVAGIAEELEVSLGGIASRLGHQPRTFAYPYGHLSDAVVHEVERRFASACTTSHRAVETRDSVHRVPRLDMFYFQAPDALDDWGTPAWSRRIAIRQAARALGRGLARMRRR